MMHSYVDEIAMRGFAVVEDVIETENVVSLLRAFANTRIDYVESQRAGKAWAASDVFSVSPWLNIA